MICDFSKSFFVVVVGIAHRNVRNLSFLPVSCVRLPGACVDLARLSRCRSSCATYSRGCFLLSSLALILTMFWPMGLYPFPFYSPLLLSSSAIRSSMSTFGFYLSSAYAQLMFNLCSTYVQLMPLDPPVSASRVLHVPGFASKHITRTICPWV